MALPGSLVGATLNILRMPSAHPVPHVSTVLTCFSGRQVEDVDPDGNASPLSSPLPLHCLA